MRFSFLKSKPACEPSLVYLRVPGCEAQGFEHFLRAAFCVIDRGAAGGLPGVKSDRLDAQTVLADWFDQSHPLEPSLRREAFCFTVIDDPLRVQAAVYRHLISVRPELVEQKPARFGTLENFLSTRKDEITRQLAAALGKRACSIADFAHVGISKKPERSIRRFSAALQEALTSVPPSRSVVRTRALLRTVLESPDATRGMGVDEVEGDVAAFRRKNPADYSLYEDALRAFDRPSRPFKRGGRARAIPVTNEPVFVFNHLPKCYGTSVRVHLAKGFSLLEDHTEFRGRPDVVRHAPCATERLCSDVVLCGHFCDGDYRLPVRYPEIWKSGSRFRIFTFVRHPLDMAISNYRHVVRTDPQIVEREPGHYATLETYLLSLHNPTAFRLGCDRTNWREIMDRHFFVGAAEHAGAGIFRLLDRMESILRHSPTKSKSVDRALAGIVALRDCEFPHANAGRSSIDKGTLSEEVKEQFMKNHEVDLLIHDYALTCEGAKKGGGR